MCISTIAPAHPALTPQFPPDAAYGEHTPHTTNTGGYALEIERVGRALIRRNYWVLDAQRYAVRVGVFASAVPPDGERPQALTPAPWTFDPTTDPPSDTPPRIILHGDNGGGAEGGGAEGDGAEGDGAEGGGAEGGGAIRGATVLTRCGAWDNLRLYERNRDAADFELCALLGAWEVGPPPAAPDPLAVVPSRVDSNTHSAETVLVATYTLVGSPRYNSGTGAETGTEARAGDRTKAEAEAGAEAKNKEIQF